MEITDEQLQLLHDFSANKVNSFPALGGHVATTITFLQAGVIKEYKVSCHTIDEDGCIIQPPSSTTIVTPLHLDNFTKERTRYNKNTITSYLQKKYQIPVREDSVCFVNIFKDLCKKIFITKDRHHLVTEDGVAVIYADHTHETLFSFISSKELKEFIQNNHK